MHRMDQMDQDFRWYHKVGLGGMLGCTVAALGFLVVAGGYTLATGKGVHVPSVSLFLWFAVLFVCEVMAFGWVLLRLIIWVGGGALLALLLIQGIRAMT